MVAIWPGWRAATEGDQAMSGTHNNGQAVVSGGSTTGGTVHVSINGSYQGTAIRNGDGSLSGGNGTTYKPNLK